MENCNDPRPTETIKYMYSLLYIALLDSVSRATVVARVSAVRPSSVSSGSQKPLHGLRPNFVGSYLCTISPENFLFGWLFVFKCSVSNVAFFYRQHGTLWRQKIQNATSPTVTVFVQYLPNFMINMLVVGKYKLLLFGDLLKIKFVWHFGTCGTQDHIVLEISKRYSPYGFHPISAKFYEDICYHGGIQAILFLAIVQV